MEKITLQPGVWTLVYATLFIQSKSNQSGLRIHYTTSDEPEPNTDLYFVTPEFDRKPFQVPANAPGMKIFLMPDKDVAVDVVTI